MSISELEQLPLTQLRLKAADLGVERTNRLKKEDLIIKIASAEAAKNDEEVQGGILEIMNEGIGFLRTNHYQAGPDDIYVSQTQIRRYGLRNGDLVIGKVRPPRDSERHYGMLKVRSVNGIEPTKPSSGPDSRT